MRQWVRKRRCVRVTRHMLAEKERESPERARERERRGVDVVIITYSFWNLKQGNSISC